MNQIAKRELNDIANRILAISNLGQWSAELVCDHHNTPASVFKLSSVDEKEKVLKIEKSESLKLKKEVNFILNNAIQNIYPQIFFHGYLEKNIYYCIMESLLLGYDSFNKLYKQNSLNQSHLAKLFKLLEFISCQSVKNKSEVVYKEHYLERLSDRLNSLKNSFLADLLSQKYIYINDKKYLNLMHAIDSTILNNNIPFFSSVSTYPGDLHFEHIFINSLGLIKIIDPKGAEYLPLEYDLGKLLHSLHGDYNILSSLDFELNMYDTNIFYFFYHFPDTKDKLLTFFENEVVSKWGTDTLKYSYLSEVFHFSSLLAHHKDNSKKILGLYCKTVQLINNYYEKFIN